MQRVAVLGVFALIATACPSGSDQAGDKPDVTFAPETTIASGAPATSVPATSLPIDGEIELPPILAPTPDLTPIDIDPAVRIGTLDNGLTYFLRSNQAPGGKLELRLAVKAGSLQQDVPDSGLAHFVEHMLFNGTESYPANELDRTLQSFGIEFGPDVNAYTSWEETVYELSLSIGDGQSVATAFDVLAEWASKATMDPDEVIAERGVVREEHRVRTETADGRLQEVFNAAYVTGTPYEGYLPIGTADNILATSGEDVRRFYDRWYRPDLMAVVVVGDLPLDVMEAEVVERFGGMEDRGDGAERIDTVQVPIDDQLVERVVDPELTRPFLSLDYWTPTWDTTTIGGDRLSILDALVGEMIRIRLESSIASGDVRGIDPFVGPFRQSRNLSFLGFNLGGSNLTATTGDLFVELRRLEEAGFSPVELERATDGFQAFFDQQLSGASTRQDEQFASQYVEHFLGSGSIDTAEATHQRASEILESVTLAELHNHYRFLLGGSAPLVIVAGGEDETVPAIADLEAAIEAAGGATIGERVEVDLIDELMTTPEPVEELERIVHEEINGVELVFENGARALFVRSDIRAGNVSLRASSDGGWSQLDAGEGPLAGLATIAVGESGLGDIDPVQLNTFLAGRSAGVSAYINELSEGFGGSASTDDLEVAFQLLHLYVTEPRIDPSGLASAIQRGEVQIREASTDPGTRSYAELVDARYGSSPFHVLAPTEAQLEAFGAEDALRIYEERLDDVDDMVLAVAGDADPDVVEDLFRRYVGTLPAGERDTWTDLRPDPPLGIIERTVDAGADDSGAGIDMWFTGLGPVDDRSALAVEIVSTMLNTRLTESVREDLGATYGGSVVAQPQKRPDELIETFIFVSGDPDRLDLIEEAVLAEVRDLADNGPSPDEFDRAVAVLGADYDFVSNGDLLGMLIELGRDRSGDPFTRVEARALLDVLTLGEVAELAGRMFPAGARLQVTRN